MRDLDVRFDEEVAGLRLMRRGLLLLLLFPLVEMLAGQGRSLYLYSMDLRFGRDDDLLEMIGLVSGFVFWVYLVVCLCLLIRGMKKFWGMRDGGVSGRIRCGIWLGVLSLFLSLLCQWYEIKNIWGMGGRGDLIFEGGLSWGLYLGMISEEILFVFGVLMVIGNLSLLYERVFGETRKLRRRIIWLLFFVTVCWFYNASLAKETGGQRDPYSHLFEMVSELLGLCLCYVWVMRVYVLVGGELDGRSLLVEQSGGSLMRGDSEVIGIDLSCIGCGYNLKGTSKVAGCMECGVLVSESLSERNFIFSDKGWRKRLALGALLIPVFGWLFGTLIFWLVSLFSNHSIQVGMIDVIFGAVTFTGYLVIWRLLGFGGKVIKRSRLGVINYWLMFVLPCALLGGHLYGYLMGEERYWVWGGETVLSGLLGILPYGLLIIVYCFEMHGLMRVLNDKGVLRWGRIQLFFRLLMFLLLFGSVAWQSIYGGELVLGGSVVSGDKVGEAYMYIDSLVNNIGLYYIYCVFVFFRIVESLGYGVRRRVVLGV